jgi:hypothetical protein
MKITTKKSARRTGYLVALTGVLFSLVGLASPSQAAYYDTDYVTTMSSSNDGVTGYIYWSNAYSGSAQLTVHNNPNDGYCVLVQDRVERGGVWSGWAERGPYCLNATYALNLTVGNNGRPVQSWQFRTRPAWASNWISDANAPGGA